MRGEIVEVLTMEERVNMEDIKATVSTTWVVEVLATLKIMIVPLLQINNLGGRMRVINTKDFIQDNRQVLIRHGVWVIMQLVATRTVTRIVERQVT